MIFIVQSGLLDPSRQTEWAAWYIDHLRIMLTVSGVISAQRLETDALGQPPSLAMYTVESEDVFTDAYYLSIRGMGSWQPLIDTRYYVRNLFASLDEAQDVGEHQRLLVADRDAPSGDLAGAPFRWLECVGLDRSTRYRGLAVIESGNALTMGEGVVVYAPVTPRFTK